MGTTTSLASSSANPLLFGEAVTYTATATPNTGNGVPTGIVEFFADDVFVGLATLNGSGQAAFTTSALAAGGHEITAAYQGDANFSGSAANAISQTVDQAVPAISLSASGNPVYGQPLTVTATLPANATGTVTFQAGGTSIGQARRMRATTPPCNSTGATGMSRFPTWT